MSWDTTRNSIVLRKDFEPGNELPFGTCELEQSFGQIESCTVTRTGNRRETLGCMNELIQLVFENPGIKCDMEVLFQRGNNVPDLITPIRIPYPKDGEPSGIGYIWGVVVPEINIKWSKGNDRLLSFTVEAWDSLPLAMANGGPGANWITDAENLDAKAYTIDPTTGDLTQITTPIP
jgi:hypothetical protein